MNGLQEAYSNVFSREHNPFPVANVRDRSGQRQESLENGELGVRDAIISISEQSSGHIHPHKYHLSDLHNLIFCLDYTSIEEKGEPLTDTIYSRFQQGVISPDIRYTFDHLTDRDDVRTRYNATRTQERQGRNRSEPVILSADIPFNNEEIGQYVDRLWPHIREEKGYWIDGDSVRDRVKGTAVFQNGDYEQPLTLTTPEIEA